MKGERSNFCYADSSLVDAYTAIWAVSDAAVVVEILLTWGASSGRIGLSETTTKLVKNTLGKWTTFDPVTIAQAAAEAYISWPGPPYTTLNYTDIEEGGRYSEPFMELEDALKKQFGG